MATGVIPSQKAFITRVAGTQQTGSLAAGGSAWIDVPYNLPNGYSPISVSRVYVTGSGNTIYCVLLSTASNVVQVAIKNYASAANNYTVDVTVTCIKTS